MALGSPPSGENENLWVYQWAEKEVSSTSPGSAVVAFEFTAKTTNTLKPLLGVTTSPALQPTVCDINSNGRYTFAKYVTSAWTTVVGNMVLADCIVYFRKNGIDTPVDGGSASITTVTEGATLITITFAQEVTSTQADYVLLSYPYSLASSPLPTTFCVKDFSAKQNGLDFSTITCIGGITHKRRQPQDLTEISLTTLKQNASLASMMIGKQSTQTFNSISTKMVSGGNYTGNWAVVLRVTDPDDAKNRIGWIAVNAGATALENKGGADADFEETMSLKVDPENYSEFEYLTT